MSEEISVTMRVNQAGEMAQGYSITLNPVNHETVFGHLQLLNLEEFDQFAEGDIYDVVLRLREKAPAAQPAPDAE